MSNPLTIRLSANEREDIKFAAAKSGLSVSEYCRRRILEDDADADKNQQEETDRTRQAILQAIRTLAENQKALNGTQASMQKMLGAIYDRELAIQDWLVYNGAKQEEVLGRYDAGGRENVQFGCFSDGEGGFLADIKDESGE